MSLAAGSGRAAMHSRPPPTSPSRHTNGTHTQSYVYTVTPLPIISAYNLYFANRRKPIIQLWISENLRPWSNTTPSNTICIMHHLWRLQGWNKCRTKEERNTCNLIVLITILAYTYPSLTPVRGGSRGFFILPRHYIVIAINIQISSEKAASSK